MTLLLWWWLDIYWNEWISLKTTQRLANPPIDQEDKVFDLTPIFLTNNPVFDDSNTAPTIESITWNVIKFLAYSVSGLAILWIIVWWFMVMLAWTGDLATQWKMTIVYSIAWMAFTIGSYALVKLVQIKTFSLW